MTSQQPSEKSPNPNQLLDYTATLANTLREVGDGATVPFLSTIAGTTAPIVESVRVSPTSKFYPSCGAIEAGNQSTKANHTVLLDIVNTIITFTAASISVLSENLGPEPSLLPTPTAPFPPPTRPARLLSWFPDAPAAPFGVHRMALAGEAAGKDVGMWFGLSAAVALRTLVEAFPTAGLGFSVATDGTLYPTDVFAASHSPIAASSESSAASVSSHGSHGRGSSSGHSKGEKDAREKVWGDRSVPLLLGSGCTWRERAMCALLASLRCLLVSSDYHRRRSTLTRPTPCFRSPGERCVAPPPCAAYDAAVPLNGLFVITSPLRILFIAIRPKRPAHINTRMRGVSAANPQASGLRGAQPRHAHQLQRPFLLRPRLPARRGLILWIPRYRPPPRRARQYHLPHPQHAEPPFPIAYSRIPSRTLPPVFPLATRSFPIAGVALVASSCAPSDRAHRSTSLTGATHSVNVSPLIESPTLTFLEMCRTWHSCAKRAPFLPDIATWGSGIFLPPLPLTTTTTFADNVPDFLDSLPARQLIDHIYAPGYLIPNATKFHDNEWIEISPVLKDFLGRICSDCRVKLQAPSRSHQHFVTCSTKFQGKYRAHIIPDYVDENLLVRSVLTANSSEPSRRDQNSSAQTG
ncbi:hypothetical protein B0H13DRAFT_2667498 [Mycena leptocephala]|nr:hypothetical protein B0H13DRAFT_2667498 [Mycena leptocephala]